MSSVLGMEIPEGNDVVDAVYGGYPGDPGGGPCPSPD